ncbi:type II toxin-antitoxin system RelE family toxin [Fodinisporobacter ferrooxydans]
MKKFKGFTDVFRYRMGDYRIVFQIKDKELVVLVVKIGICGNVYNDL